MKKKINNKFNPMVQEDAQVPMLLMGNVLLDTPVSDKPKERKCPIDVL